MFFAVLRHSAYLLIFMFGFLLIACQFYLDTWLGDLLNNFRMQYIVGFLFLTVLALLFRDYSAGLVFSFFVGFFFILNYDNKALVQVGGDAQGEYSLTTFNVFTGNWSHQKIINFIKKQQSDIFILQEVTPSLYKKLQDKKWGYRYIEKNYSSDHTVVLSKHPILKVKSQSKYVKGLSSTILQVICNLPTGVVRILALHLTNPIEYNNFKYRSIELNKIAQVIAGNSDNLIVAGDFNLTPWSYYMYNFVKATNLRLINSGIIYQPTWMRRKPWVTIPIDHVLFGNKFKVKDRSVDNDSYGSDHYPVTLRFDY